MRREDDFSGEHFEWLVAGRSRNQQAALKLYKIVKSDPGLLAGNIALQNVADKLVGIVFSLWRAVFLSDLTGEVVDQMADLQRFLQSLIAHNAVLYQTDFSAREWTFGYYLENAVLRLDQLPNAVLPPVARAKVSGSAKEDWVRAENSLEAAIAKFAEMIADRQSS